MSIGRLPIRDCVIKRNGLGERWNMDWTTDQSEAVFARQRQRAGSARGFFSLEIHNNVERRERKKIFERRTEYVDPDWPSIGCLPIRGSFPIERQRPTTERKVETGSNSLPCRSEGAENGPLWLVGAQQSANQEPSSWESPRPGGVARAVAALNKKINKSLAGAAPQPPMWHHKSSVPVYVGWRPPMPLPKTPSSAASKKVSFVFFMILSFYLALFYWKRTMNPQVHWLLLLLIHFFYVFS